METKCNGCDAVILDLLHMKCSRAKCRKLYHLKCLAWSEVQFAAFTQEFKNKWICPECTCTIPKKGNSETPVRGSTTMDKTSTPSYVNTERGTRRNTKEVSMIENESLVLDELRQFRLEIGGRLEEQRTDFILLQNKLIATETELKEIKLIMKVLQEKANKVDILETKIQELIEKSEKLEASLCSRNIKEKSTSEKAPKTSSMTFAKIVKKNQTEVISNLPAKECVATKPANIVILEENIHETRNERIVDKECENAKIEGKWTLVQRKSRYPNSEVRKGGSTNSTEILGTEKKKYLHVWRLQKDTSVENLEKYVKKLYDGEVTAKIERIKQKTERDYASFIIGVPESKYDVLCQPESWPVNIEFCEWVWFRRHNNKSKPPE